MAHFPVLETRVGKAPALLARIGSQAALGEVKDQAIRRQTGRATGTGLGSFAEEQAELAGTGLAHKGHLGVGADGDVALYHQKPSGGRMFEYPRYVIKGGEVVVEDGQIRAVSQGRQYIVQPAYDEHIEAFLRPVFQKVYTMEYRPNTLFAFFKTDNSFHGVAPIADADVLRDLLLYDIRVEAAPPRETRETDAPRAGLGILRHIFGMKK